MKEALPYSTFLMTICILSTLFFLYVFLGEKTLLLSAHSSSRCVEVSQSDIHHHCSTGRVIKGTVSLHAITYRVHLCRSMIKGPPP